MKVLTLLPLATLGCSVDWSLARQAPPIADAVAPSEGSVVASALIHCDQLIPLASDPLIDGALEPNLTSLRWIDESWPGAPAGIRATVALAYRPNGVYFFVDVEDPTRDPAPIGTFAYCGDAVEVFVDDDGAFQAAPDYDDPGTVQLVVAGPADTTAPSHRGQRFRFATGLGGRDLGAWSSNDFVAVPTARGYAIEALVVAGDLDLDAWTLAPGAKIGWNLSLNIGGPKDAGVDACTTRSTQLHLRLAPSGSCTPPYCNASAFCTPMLAVQ